MNTKTKYIFITLSIIAIMLSIPNGASAAENIIATFEVGDISNPYLLAVPDTNGFWQIGFGSTFNYDLKRYVKKGDTISVEQALRYMRNEIKEKSLLIDRLVKVPLTKNQHDSLVSLCYNIGSSAFEHSTLLKLLNSHADIKLVANQFDRWVFADGVAVQGLVTRRKKEKELFLS